MDVARGPGDGKTRVGARSAVATDPEGNIEP